MLKPTNAGKPRPSPNKINNSNNSGTSDSKKRLRKKKS